MPCLQPQSGSILSKSSLERTVLCCALLCSGTVMAYGQTGAGKTFTMTGHTDNYRLRGIIPRAISHIFQEIRLRPDLAVAVRVSYVQIYNEVMRDLLATLPDNREPHPLTVVEVPHTRWWPCCAVV